MKFEIVHKRLLILLLMLCLLLVGCEKGRFSKTEEIETQQNVEVVDTDKCRTVYLNVSESYYYPVLLPADIQYTTDNSKYIYNSDESMSITIVSSVDMYKFSESVFINNAENIEQYLIATKDYADADIKEAALYLTGDKAVRVRVDGDTKLFQTILYGLQKYKVKNIVMGDLEISEALLQTTELPKYNGEIVISAGLGEDLRKSYVFDDGHLNISREFRKYQEAQELYKQRLSVIANTNIADYYYCDDNIMYLEIGDYVVAVYHMNFNTVFTCIGKGNTAKCNAIFFMENQR